MRIWLLHSKDRGISKVGIVILTAMMIKYNQFPAPRWSRDFRRFTWI